MNNTVETVAGLLSEILSGDLRDMDAAFTLSAENGVTPIDVARLAIACERQFRLTLHDEEIAAWQTIGDACTYIDTLIEEGMAESTERTDGDRMGWYYE